MSSPILGDNPWSSSPEVELHPKRKSSNFVSNPPKRLRLARPPYPPVESRIGISSSAPAGRAPSTDTLATPESSEADASESVPTNTRSRTAQTKAYRGLIRKAGIVPESWGLLPAPVQAAVDDVLSPGEQRGLRMTASRFCARSRELTKDDANDAAWRLAMYAMADEIRFETRTDDLVKLSFEQLWCADLLPRPRNRQELLRPRPDLQLALSEQALGRARSDLLELLSRDARLISNPSQQTECGHFPFLVCELRSGATGGNLFGAQNETSVAAAAALRIRNTLQALSGSPDTPAQYPVFAFCGEGSRFDLHVFHSNPQTGEYTGKRIGHWDSTNETEAMSLVSCIAKIQRWAVGSFAQVISHALNEIAQQQRRVSNTV